jgi:hypothetical protein
MQPAPRNPHPLLVGTLLAISLALRIPGMLESLWFDEVWRTFVVLRPDGIKNLLLHDVHNPFYNALMYAWIRLFGDSEVSIRTPSLIAGYTLTWLIWRWTRERLGPRIAFIAAAWLLFSPVPMWYSAEAKNSVFTVLTSAFVLTTHDRLLEGQAKGSVRRIAACVIAAVLAILTDFQTLLIIVPVWAGIAIEAARARRDPNSALAVPGARPGLKLVQIMAATTVLLLPLLILKATNISELPRDYTSIFNIKHLLWFLCLWMPIGTVLPNFPPGWWPAEVAITGVLLLPLMYLGIRHLWRLPSGRMVTRAFVFPLLFYLIASAILHAIGNRVRIYQDRNIIVLMAWYPVVLAAGIDSITRARLRTLATAAVLGGALVSSILICTVLADRWTVLAPNPDWREAAKLIDAAPGKALVISRTAMLPMKYYSKDSELREFSRDAVPVDAIAKILAESPPSPPNSDDFFLLSNPWWSGLTPKEMPAIDAAFPLIERTNLRSLVIERRRRNPQQ